MRDMQVIFLKNMKVLKEISFIATTEFSMLLNKMEVILFQFPPKLNQAQRNEY